MQNEKQLSSPFRLLGIILLLALLYFGAGVLSLSLISGAKGIITTGIFASEGIALAFALYYGKQVWPGIFIGQLLFALYNDTSVISSISIAAINSLEAVIATHLIRKYNVDIHLNTPRDVFYLVVIILFVLQVISALFSNTVLYLNHEITKDAFVSSVFSWWFGNVIGQLLFTPFILFTLLHAKTIEFINYLVYGLVFGFFVYVIVILFEVKSLMLLQSITIPVVIFVVYFKGNAYGMLFSVILAFVEAYALHIGIGAFEDKRGINNVIDYNLFVLNHIVIVLSAGILFQKQRVFEQILQKRIEEEVEKNKEQQLFLMQQSRLAQMGEMIAMIAHQWRQPLNNLALSLEILKVQFKMQQLTEEKMEKMHHEAKKQIQLMSQTIDDFRNFFKTNHLKKKFCINDVIEETISLVAGSYNAQGIEISQVKSQKCYTFGYPNDLGQAVLNILNNAKDVLITQEQKEKKIEISIEKEDDAIKIGILDNGGGIDQKIIQKIFDPYFTTKESKNGTGLGLYMTRMIIQEKLDGKIYVTNKKEGAYFTILLKEVREEC